MKLIVLVLLLSSGITSRAFQIIAVPEQIPESNPVTRSVVSEGRTTFSFIMPPTWISSANAAARKITFESPAPRATLSISMLTNAFPGSAAEFKASVLKTLQNPEVLEEMRAFSGGGGGLGMDVRHEVSGKFIMISRVNWFSAPEGVIEVSMSASPEDFPKLHNAWTGFLNSFRVEKDRRTPPR